MIFEFGTALLFVFLCVVLGSWLSLILNNHFGKRELAGGLFLNFLSGFATLGTYFNVWSVFLPVDYLSLLPLFLMVILLLLKLSVRSHIQQLYSKAKALIKPAFLFCTLPVVLVILLFSVLAPQHGDSPGYHYASIRWIEEYKVIPGLANVHGRFGFNSSFFTTSAPFTLQALARQALYPLNIGFTIALFSWLLYKVFNYRRAWWGIVYIFAIIALIRGIILTISSPTPDIAATIVMFFVLTDIAEKTIRRSALTLPYKIQMSVLILFAVTVKLSCLFLTPVLLFLFFDGNVSGNKKVLATTTFLGILVVVPWVVRNYILTGYLVYPLAFTGFLSPDWQVPFSVLHFDKLLINNGPKMISENWEAVDKLSLTKWLPLWVKVNFENGLVLSFALLVCSVVCLFLGLIVSARKRNYKLTIILIINSLAVFYWLVNSPDYRFGYAYLVAAIVILSLYLTVDKTVSKALSVGAFAVLPLACVYYLNYGAGFMKDYSISKYWLKPVPPRELEVNNDTASFRFIRLNAAVKLYVGDKYHDCNNANLPCFSLFFPRLKPEQIEARGNKIEDGFRIKSEIKP